MASTPHTRLVGFTAVELLVTLFVAALALASGYQLYAAVIKQDGDTRAETAAGFAAYEKVKQYSIDATTPCTPSTPVDDANFTLFEQQKSRLVVTITCPNLALPNMSKVTATISYDTPEKTVTHSTFVTPGAP